MCLILKKKIREIYINFFFVVDLDIIIVKEKRVKTKLEKKKCKTNVT
jgi:hypothetical protein